MTWQAILSELKQTACLVGNRGPASDSILGVKHLTIQHSIDHWEELHAPIHATFRWGQGGGLLSAQSSQADFLVVCDFLWCFAEAEDSIGEGSCLPALMPRMRRCRCDIGSRAAAHLNRSGIFGRWQVRRRLSTILGRQRWIPQRADIIT
ncbi:hypothetical protein BDN67DRAFT_968683 [Paxillus ammoniavirescens]|nr:hypothetical protein BDN67DRAFT_968683 [Paxillus ammoniavirescens]